MDLSLQPQQRNGLVVQLVRMPPCHGGGRGFESRPVRKKLLIYQELFCLQSADFTFKLISIIFKNRKLRLRTANHTIMMMVCLLALTDF